MRITEVVNRRVKDLFLFGPVFIIMHLGWFPANKILRIDIKGVGPLYLRAGNSDAAVIRQIFESREYALPGPDALTNRIQARYDAILKAGGKPIIVDAGANIGAASLWFTISYPDAAVISIEPDPDNSRVLQRNMAGRRNCTILETAIGAEPGFVTLKNDQLGWAVQTERAESGVRIVTVEDAFKASGGDTPFIVKIDIEGFERDLFASNLSWLDSVYIVIIEPHDWLFPGELTSLTFQRAMSEHKFEMFVHGENIFYVRV